MSRDHHQNLQRKVFVLPLMLLLLMSLPVLAQGQERQPGDSHGVVTTAPHSGWYRPLQAEAGEELYNTHCARCHGIDLQGNQHNPPLAGGEFMRRWSGESLERLYHYTRATMPLDNPSSLSSIEYINIIAYILQQNDFPAGQEPLRADRHQLGQLVLAPEETEGYNEEATDSEESEETPGEAPEEETAVGDAAAEGTQVAYYSERQAERGQEVYQQNCAGCHGPDLQGEPPLLRDDFLERWATVGELFQFTRMHQPDLQAELDAQQFADVVAFILQQNGLPAGEEELPPEQERLDELPLEPSKEEAD